jgi:hypothetical protein
MNDQPTIENTKHDYEPGDTYGYMSTNPLCRICGQSSRARVHN